MAVSSGLALLAAAFLGADFVPRPPCGGETFPPFPELDSPPVVQVWEHSDWTPSTCAGLTEWVKSGPATLVATVARFRDPSGAEGLRRRIGAVSGLNAVRYWSTTNQRWQPLIANAYALSGPTGDRRRQDFLLDETAQGREIYVEQEDNLLGKAVYRIRMAAVSADRLVFATENVSAISLLGIPVFPPGDIQSTTFLERERNDVWRYYSLARLGKQASVLVAGHSVSLINRAVASYRYLAGIPTDREPPAAR